MSVSMSMSGVAVLVVVCVVMMLSGSVVDALPFRFTTAYGDHMVLQRAPKQAVVSGFGVPDASVIVRLSDAASPPVTATVDSNGKWQIALPAHAAGGPYTLTAQSGAATVTLSDILFGDVWVCSGQSNMQFTVSIGDNATAEAAAAVNYPNIRFNSPAQIASSVPQDEIGKWAINWTIATPQTVGGPGWAYLSGACWFFARNIYDTYGIPLGLIATSYGGTAVEWWSSPDALAKCKTEETGASDAAKFGEPRVPGINPSELWNAMIVPFLKTTIYGAIWYQGESNAGGSNYWCTFPAMVDDWRLKWGQNTGQTDATFPFGFVQLSTWNADDNAVASLRWQQTANFGYVPNTRQVNYFMSEAMDLGSPAPGHDIHPTNKQDVGKRLALGGRAIAYGESSLYWTGPLVQSASIELSNTTNDASVRILFRNTGATGIELRNGDGFELQDKASHAWLKATATQVSSTTVLVSGPVLSGVAGVRYGWKAVPCEQKLCALYSKTEAIPGPPFLYAIA